MIISNNKDPESLPSVSSQKRSSSPS